MLAPDARRERMNADDGDGIAGKRFALMQLRSLDLFEQHRGDHRKAVFRLQRQSRDHVGFCCKQVNRRAHVARMLNAHDGPLVIPGRTNLPEPRLTQARG